MKKIIVGLDESEYSRSAVRAAVEISARSRGELTGITFIDIPGIERSLGPIPPGGMYFAEQALAARVREREALNSSLAEEFLRICEGAQAEAVAREVRGNPFQQLLEEGKTADLIVLGIRTFFQFAAGYRAGDTLQRLAARTVCPILVLPEKTPLLQRVIIAYDGSIPASRALRAFAPLAAGFALERVVLLNINEDQAAGEELLRKAQEYLRVYAIATELQVVSGDPRVQILRQAEANQPALLVMGSFGHSKIRDLLWGSSTRRALETMSIPLLLYY